jgi:diguanylate cyclase (GGDEF)-like protein
VSAHKILVVDDDQQFRCLVSRLLVDRGHQVIEAASGRAGESALARERPDMMIVDGLLPDGDGVSWLDGRRKQGDTTPAVFVSAFWRDLKSYRRLTGELGVALVLHKPIVPAAFAEQIEGVLASLPAAAKAAASAPAPAPAAEAIPELDLDMSTLLAEAGAEYGAALPGKLTELRGLAERALAGDAAALQPLRDLAHRLSGTAGSYGFVAAGDAAAALEALARRRLDGHEVAPAEWRAALARTGAGAATVPKPSVPVTSTSASYRVLLVDDDRPFLDLCVRLGHQRSIEIVPVATVAEARTLAESSRFDAALIDLRLDGDDAAGLELAHALRALPACEALPLAFVSAAGDVADRIAATHAGASLFLSKPIDVETLSMAVHQLTAAQRAARPRALVVDDDPAFTALATGVLAEAGIDASPLSDPHQILEKLEEVRPEVLLLDVNMRDLSGFDLCRMIRAMPRWQDLIILFVTAEGALASRVVGFQVGGDDYLLKPVVREELLARLKVRVERARLLRDLHERDPLTGLPSRRVFLEQLSARLGEAHRRGRCVSLALLDVDHFKAVNDRHGHLTGDRVLATLGALLGRRFRGEDLRGRWGGEEFVLAFVEEDPQTVAHVLERVRDELGKIEMHGERGEAFRVTFSAGVAGWPDEAESVHELIAVADRRLYAAKAAGRARVVPSGR